MRHLFFSRQSRVSPPCAWMHSKSQHISIPPLFCLLMHRRGTDLPRRVYRSGELAPARATRRSESSPSPRLASPLRDAPRHYRVPRHFLRGPFLWSETHPSRNSCQRAHMGPKTFTKTRAKGPKFSGAARRNPANLRAGRPTARFRSPTHIEYVSVQPFFPAWLIALP